MSWDTQLLMLVMALALAFGILTGATVTQVGATGWEVLP